MVPCVLGPFLPFAALPVPLELVPPVPVSVPDTTNLSTPSIPSAIASPSPNASPAQLASESPSSSPPLALSSTSSTQLFQPPIPTHAGRSSLIFQQPSRQLAKPSDAQKASSKIQHDVNEADQKILNAELTVLLEKHRLELMELADHHAKKISYIDKLIGTSKHYKVQRAVNLENAKLHAKASEINADRSVGDRMKLAKLRQMVKEDPAMQDLSKEEEDELREEVVAVREQKKLGARPTNQSAAQDYRSQLEALNDQITALLTWTGAAAVCFFSRSHLQDTFKPNWICTENASRFSRDVLDKDMWDMTRLFEKWCCTKGNARTPDCLASMRQECSNMINGTLKTAAGVPMAIMNYNNYEVNVVLKYKVRLTGWPHDKFISPYNFNTIDELRDLRDALRCGSCFWMGLSKRQTTQHVKEMKERTEAGEVIGKKPKERSDKGSKKGPRNQPVGDDADEGEVPGGSDGAGPSKRQKVTSKRAKGKENTKKSTSKRGPTQSARTQIPPTSSAIISDSDGDDD